MSAEKVVWRKIEDVEWVGAVSKWLAECREAAECKRCFDIYSQSFCHHRSQHKQEPTR